jgi:hypothetical protein
MFSVAKCLWQVSDIFRIYQNMNLSEEKKGRAGEKIVGYHQLLLCETVLVYQFAQNLLTVERYPDRPFAPVCL